MKPITTLPAIIGAIIIKKRKAKHIKQGELATRLGIDRSVWSRIENGKTPITLIDLQSASKVLDATMWEIIKLAEEKEIILSSQGINIASSIGENTYAMLYVYGKELARLL